MTAARSPSFISGSSRSWAKKSLLSHTGPTTSTVLVRRILWLADGNDLVITLVKRWPDQIVHAGIDDDEFLVLRLLEIANPR